MTASNPSIAGAVLFIEASHHFGLALNLARSVATWLSAVVLDIVGHIRRGIFRCRSRFNAGLHDVYGVKDKGSKAIWAYDPDASLGEDGEVVVCRFDAYERPQSSACFIIKVDGSIEDIWQLMDESARLFKYGSGVGADWRHLRSTKDRLSGGGTPSGPVSFMKVQDATAGTIKNGRKCLAPWTQVYTAKGPLPVETLNGTCFVVLSYDPPAGRFMAKWATAWRGGTKQVVRITTDKGIFDVTVDHPIRLSTGEAVQAGDLRPGMSLARLSTNEIAGAYVRINLQNGRKGKELLHRLIARDLMGIDLAAERVHVHHEDENPANNDPSNLRPLRPSDHAGHHSRGRVEAGTHIFQQVGPGDQRFQHTGERNGMHRSNSFWTSKRAAEYREAKRAEIRDRDPVRMQNAATRQRHVNEGYQFLNAGYDISTEDKYFEAYFHRLGRRHEQNRRRKEIAFRTHFGSYEGFLRALAEENHRVVSVTPIGTTDVYGVTVECASPDDLSPMSGHTFVIWPMENGTPYGSGIVVYDSRRPDDSM